MRANEFQGWWSARFGLNLPLGWVLRDAFRERWVRFHTLPASKRYPETAQELAEILRRHAALTEELFSAGSDCWFVTVTFERATSDRLTLPELPGLPLERVIQTSCPDPVVADDVTIWAASVTWDRDRFEEARRASPAAEYSPVIGIHLDPRRVPATDRGHEQSDVMSPLERSSTSRSCREARGAG